MRDYELAGGRFFEKKYDALLEAGFARGLGVKRRRRGQARHACAAAERQPARPFKVVGLLSPRGAAGFKQGGIIFLPAGNGRVAVLQGRQRQHRSASCWPTAPTKRPWPRPFAAALPTGLSVRSPIERSQLSKETIEKVQKGLDFAYVMILALAFFTILNTFLMNVGERRRQLAVLRAIGTTRRQTHPHVAAGRPGDGRRRHGARHRRPGWAAPTC